MQYDVKDIKLLFVHLQIISCGCNTDVKKVSVINSMSVITATRFTKTIDMMTRCIETHVRNDFVIKYMSNRPSMKKRNDDKKIVRDNSYRHQ